MRDEHITDILDRGPVTGLDETELARVRDHAGRCAECAGAYEAARISSLLLSERAAGGFEPPPFFQTRVLAALRERQAAAQAWSLRRLWNAAGALVASMAVTVAALAALTFLAPESQPADGTQQVASASDIYSSDELLLAAGADEEMTDEQVLSSIYETADDSAR